MYTVPARYALAMTLVFARDLYKWNIPALLAASDMKGRGSYTGWFTMHSFLEALSNSLHSAGLKSFRRNSGTESDLRALGLWAMPLCGAAPAWLFRTVRLSEISSKKGDKFRWPTITHIRGGDETASALQGLGSTVGALMQRFDEWVRDNPEVMARWRDALLAVKAELIDDLAAEDGSEVRAILFEPEDLRTVIRHGWYPPPDIALAQLRIWANGFRDPDEERAESARQIGFMVFRRDAKQDRTDTG